MKVADRERFPRFAPFPVIGMLGPLEKRSFFPPAAVLMETVGSNDSDAMEPRPKSLFRSPQEPASRGGQRSMLETLRSR